MKRTRFGALIFGVVLVFILSSVLLAKDSIELTSGKVLTGQVKNETDKTIEIVLDSGIKMAFSLGQVRAITSGGKHRVLHGGTASVTPTGGRPEPAGPERPAPAKRERKPGEAVLVRDGEPAMEILVSKEEADRLAKPPKGRGKPVPTPAQELQRYIEKMSGAKLEIVSEGSGTGKVCVGKVSDFPSLGLEEEAKELGPEGIIIRSDGQSLVLVGKESPGVQHAVQTFLQLIGCRWFFPGATWEVIPERKTIAGRWNVKHSPSFKIQRHMGYGFGSYGKNSADKRAWDRHNRMGGPMRVSIGHAGHGLTEEDFKRNPDLYAMRKGKRVQGSKPCYSHPEYIKIAVENALERAAGGAKMIAMTPADGLGYCECPLCQKWGKGAAVYWTKGSQFAKRPDGVLVCITSESLFNCINEVARAVSEKYPDTLVGSYAYSAYSHPPSFKLEPNVFVQTTTAYRRTPISLYDQLHMFKKMGVQSGIRGYWAVYQWDWDYPQVKGFLGLPGLARDLKMYDSNDVESLNTEMSCNWGPRGIGYYVGARLLWDVNADPRALIADFYVKAFGPAAEPMENYYVRWLGPYVKVLDKVKLLPEGAFPKCERSCSEWQVPVV